MDAMPAKEQAILDRIVHGTWEVDFRGRYGNRRLKRAEELPRGS